MNIGISIHGLAEAMCKDPVSVRAYFGHVHRNKPNLAWGLASKREQSHRDEGRSDLAEAWKALAHAARNRVEVF